MHENYNFLKEVQPHVEDNKNLEEDYFMTPWPITMENMIR